MIEGSIVALSTPFSDEGINFSTMERLIYLHNGSGTSGILLLGTTGESPTVSEDERGEIIRFTKERIKCSLIVGTGTNSTEKTIRLTKQAADLGADYALIITPYYNKPTQSGLRRHFEKVARAVEIPIIIYNVPSRTGVNIVPETVNYLSMFDNIVGIKEASGNLRQITEIISSTAKDFSLLSGDDMLTLPIISVGGKGVISVTANIVPEDVSKMVNYALNNKWEEAKVLNKKLYYLSRALFIETNPIPVKTALKMLGYNMGELRSPLSEMSTENRAKLKEALINCELLSGGH